jgi:DNA-binding MarR family transcriptional regulator/GNAT superfamily N-acetyltransferase
MVATGTAGSPPDDPATRVEAVRTFNRFWTARIGVLDATHLGTRFSLAEARILFELAQHDAVPVGDLRRRLELDAGYLSRLLADFRAKKLVATSAADDDARRQVARLTAKGRAAAAELNARAIDHVRGLLGVLGEQEQRRLLGALASVQALLERGTRRASPSVVLRPPRPGDLGWVVERHGAIYAAEYGWDRRFEGLVASIVAEHAAADDAGAAAWVAEVDGERAGCIFCMRKDARTAQLRLLLVEPRFRGHGLGRMLVDECVRFAAAHGYRKMTLWTNDVLVEARRIYERAGFALVSSKRHTSFGKELTGQTWERALG